MTRDVIDIHDWEGSEFHELFVDYVEAGMAEGKAQASVDTGAMVESVQVVKIRDGFRVWVHDGTLGALSGKKLIHGSYNYSYKYGYIGYTKQPAFDFLYSGLMSVDLGDKVSSGSTWSARKPNTRNGSGSSRVYSKDFPKKQSYLASKKSKAIKRRPFPIPKRLLK